MLISVDTHSGVPVFRQIMDQVRFQIASGVLKPADQLPPTRALSAQLGVNPMTVSKAYGFLEKEGVVEHRPGRPLVVGNIRQKELESARLAQLQEALRPVVTIAGQLDIGEREAVQLFRAMLKSRKE